MPDPQLDYAIFHCLTEENDWEGETWYHYFLDGPGVLDVLKLAYKIGDDLTALETVSMTWDEAGRLTNQDHGTYVQCHWFGDLINPEGLRTASSNRLYKGGIRDFGRELFG